MPMRLPGWPRGKVQGVRASGGQGPAALGSLCCRGGLHVGERRGLYNRYAAGRLAAMKRGGVSHGMQGWSLLWSHLRCKCFGALPAGGPFIPCQPATFSTASRPRTLAARFVHKRDPLWKYILQTRFSDLRSSQCPQGPRVAASQHFCGATKRIARATNREVNRTFTLLCPTRVQAQ